ncbi:tetratricopeptide repeat-containing sensor histidine kinase [Dyadobacter fanqingshengii]|uniref:Sensor histidine kinase n=1 Tax=Dyadobacter fanqingshengii TaxID=2906443 RepID=A0A9X1P977_9BACT|nr:sensor histidine kinase [Dyadobacter fanqingshengii]MCF0039000.1 sensor histidine kinase [Dyadobacter fanqingshengii]USJ34178.1 sensor histidine kinase [Dyadobacter fanqingshengii]
MKLVYTTALLFFLYTHASAQSADAILKKIRESKEDTNRVLAYIEYGQLLENQNLDSAGKYYLKAEALSQKLDYNMGKFKFRSNYTYILNLQGKFEQGLKLNRESFDIARDMKHEVNIGKSLANIATSHVYMGNFTEAIKYYQRSADQFEKLGMKEFLPRLYISIGSAFEHANLFNKSLVYKQKALQLARPMKDSLTLADILTNLGGCYFNLKRYKEGLAVYTEGLAVAQKIKSDIFVVQAYGGLCRVNRGLKKLDIAREYGEKGLDLARKTGNVFLEMECLRALMFVAEDSNQPELSAKYTREALKIAEDNEMTDHLVELYEDYATDLARENNYKGAYDYLMKYTIMNDSIQGLDIQKQLQELDTKYLTAQKEKQIVTLEKEKQTRNTLIYSLIAGLVVFILIAVLVYRNIAIRKRIAEQEVLQLQQEKQLVATNSILKGQEEERTRVARDLHDGLGGLLSGIKLTLNSVKGNVILPEESAMTFTRALTQLDGAISEMRRVAHSMMPETLVRFGLIEALNDFCEGISASGQLKVTMQDFGFENRLDSSIEIVLYRVVQELLNNVLKYAEATEAQVQLTWIGNNVSLTVEDNGKGFDVRSLETSKGAGFRNVQARVDYLNGKLDIQSTPEEGTSVLVEIVV